MGDSVKELIDSGKTAIGIEFGSTRIKAVLVDDKGRPLAQGGHGWENQYENGVWTYSLDMIWNGLQSAYSDLLADVKNKYDTVIKKTGAIGFSAMMHGYMAFDDKDNLLEKYHNRGSCKRAYPGVWFQYSSEMEYSTFTSGNS